VEFPSSKDEADVRGELAAVNVNSLLFSFFKIEWRLDISPIRLAL